MALSLLWMLFARWQKLVLHLAWLALSGAMCTSAHAGDGGGGCSVSKTRTQMLAFGTVADVERDMASTIASRIAVLKKGKKFWQAEFVATPEWIAQQRHDLMHGPVQCASGAFPLDYAVTNGNLDVVTWLLDDGVDPNAADPSQFYHPSIFLRCGIMSYVTPPSGGMSKEEIHERRMTAYRMLIARGADIKHIDPFRDISGCLNSAMYPDLKRLGAQVTRGDFVSWARAAYQGGRAILESKWSTVEELARDQDFDFRGTAFEFDLLRTVGAQAAQPGYPHAVEWIRRLGGIVRLSPGLIPGAPALPSDIPGKFNPVREVCAFPEIGAYPDFEFIVVMRKKKEIYPPPREHSNIEILVGATRAPVMIVAINEPEAPVTWIVRGAKQATILGVIALNGSNLDQVSEDTVRFDDTRPAFIGKTGACDLLITRGDPVNGVFNVKLEPFRPPDPHSHTFNPFILRSAPPVHFLESDRFNVGEISSAMRFDPAPETLRGTSVTSKP